MVDIYGAGYYDRPNALTGPLSFRSPTAQKAWLATYDPSVRIKNMSAPVLLLSGTNDMFFPLKQLMLTYDNLPTAKRLILAPNVNHGLTVAFIEVQAQVWFDHYLKNKPLNLPEIAALAANGKTVKGRIELNGQVLKNVTLHYSWTGEKEQPDVKSQWQSRPAELLKENFMVELPQTAPDAEHRRLNYYVAAVMDSGAAVSSTVSSIAVETVTTAVLQKSVEDVGNFFADPSLEKQRNRGFSGKVFFNYSGTYVYDDSGSKARSGKAAVHLSGPNQLIMEAKNIIPGTTYILSGWFKGAEKSGSANLRINWMANGKFVKTALFLGNVSADTYQQLTLPAAAPEGTTSAILFFNAADAWVDDLSFAPQP